MVAENSKEGVTTATQNTGHVNKDELLSLRVMAGTKRIFLALCENDRGRYLKISAGRCKLIVPKTGFANLRAAIDSLHHMVTTGSQASGQKDSRAARRPHPKPLHAERFRSKGRKYYLDLLENKRGHYVKFSQVTTRRVSMIFSASAVAYLREALVKLVDFAPKPTLPLTTTGHTARTVERQIHLDNGTTVAMKAVQREVRVESKRLIFESGANRRGSYLRITDTSGTNKVSVTVPHSAISSIITLLREIEEAGDPLEDFNAAVAAPSLKQKSIYWKCKSKRF